MNIMRQWSSEEDDDDDDDEYDDEYDDDDDDDDEYDDDDDDDKGDVDEDNDDDDDDIMHLFPSVLVYHLGRGAIYHYDALGSFERVIASCCGKGEHLIQPILGQLHQLSHPIYHQHSTALI